MRCPGSNEWDKQVFLYQGWPCSLCLWDPTILFCMCSSGLWSLFVVNSVPKRYCLNFLKSNIIDSASVLFVAYLGSAADSVLNVNAISFSLQSENLWHNTASIPTLIVSQLNTNGNVELKWTNLLLERLNPVNIWKSFPY